jgi:cobalamin synthase
MSTGRTGLIGTLSAILSFLAVFLIYTSLEPFPGAVTVLAIAVCGVVIGLGQGWCIQPPQHRTIGMATFVGLLILWLPVVFVTYGFALLAVPLLAVFALLVFFGARLGSHLRASACRPA